MPTLSDRKDDIPLLVDAFVKRISEDMGKPAPVFKEEAVAELQNYRWTGNIRELQNVVERLVILCGNTITEDDVKKYAQPLVK